MIVHDLQKEGYWAVDRSKGRKVPQPKRKKDKKSKEESRRRRRRHEELHGDYKIGMSYKEFVDNLRRRQNRAAESEYRKLTGSTNSFKDPRERLQRAAELDKDDRGISKSSSVRTISGGLPTLGKDR